MADTRIKTQPNPAGTIGAQVATATDRSMLLTRTYGANAAVGTVAIQTKTRRYLADTIGVLDATAPATPVSTILVKLPSIDAPEQNWRSVFLNPERLGLILPGDHGR